MACNFNSCSTASTTAPRALSSISISSLMYVCSKTAQALSSVSSSGLTSTTFAYVAGCLETPRWSKNRQSLAQASCMSDANITEQFPALAPNRSTR
eukprot:CAMPEP_0117608180 /NCGR_PEP_ID=MMETSP0784-20121206/80677_1 /TAXON_ID=39447 /ORGANISM="" /LENGTH=95 /DNA_ID=CAMNT_0005411449 /DNA_START=298 /DNA_END=585 /DNA_ORIENTATION=-